MDRDFFGILRSASLKTWLITIGLVSATVLSRRLAGRIVRGRKIADAAIIDGSLSDVGPLLWPLSYLLVLAISGIVSFRLRQYALSAAFAAFVIAELLGLKNKLGRSRRSCAIFSRGLEMNGLFYGYGKLEGRGLDANRLSVRKNGRSATVDVPAPKIEELASALPSAQKWGKR